MGSNNLDYSERGAGMITVHGKTVFDGVAVGRILFYGKKQEKVKRERVENTEKEECFK